MHSLWWRAHLCARARVCEHAKIGLDFYTNKHKLTLSILSPHLTSRVVAFLYCSSVAGVLPRRVQPEPSGVEGSLVDGHRRHLPHHGTHLRVECKKRKQAAPTHTLDSVAALVRRRYGKTRTPAWCNKRARNSQQHSQIPSTGTTTSETRRLASRTRQRSGS